jgi:hypothetical protein
MPRPTLPPDVQRFLLTRIPSIPFLEALLLFHREQPRPLAAAEVGHRLYLGESGAARLLDALTGAGMVVCEPGSPPGYRFNTADVELNGLVDNVRQCYANHLIEMTHLIHDRTRKSASQFADAFRLRKEP